MKNDIIRHWKKARKYSILNVHFSVFKEKVFSGGFIVPISIN